MSRNHLLICFAGLIGSLFPSISFSQEKAFQSQVDSKPVIILDEEMNILVTGQKAYLMELQVSRTVSYKINRTEGIDLLDTLTLPESFDETYILHCTDIRSNMSSVSGLKVLNFSAQLEKPDGSIKTIDPVMNTLSKRIISTSLGEAYFYQYCFNQLQAGDILKISYSYSYLFKDNWYRLFSMRVFFHSKYPKLNYSFSLTHPSNLEIDTFLVNLEPPVFKNENNYKTYSWQMKNLPGCIDEPGCRPYMDLPNFTFSLKPYDLLYEHFNSFKQEFVPLWYYLCYDREDEISLAVIDQTIGAKDKENLAFEKLANRFITMSGVDNSGIKCLQNFQKWMIDTVKYDNSYLFYDNQQNYKASRPGLELMGGTLPDYGIESAYASMILKLGLNFLTAYPVDKRCGQISKRYYSPMYDNDVLFAAILKSNIFAYLLPFSQHNRYYCEELPFYYEDVPVMLISSYDFGGYKLNIEDSARMARTPASLFTDNIRKVTTEVNIALDSGIAYFNARVNLSGQYSTLCRFSYLNKPVDLSIDKGYNQRIWDIGHLVSVTKFNAGKTDLFFPFSTAITATYSCKELIEKTSDGYTIDMSNWINHSVPESYDSTSRSTDFYPDFIGQDTYIFKLTFDSKIKMEDGSRNILLQNAFGDYKVIVQQQSDNIILVTSQLLNKAPVVERENYPLLVEMFHEINKSEKLILQVKAIE